MRKPTFAYINAKTKSQIRCAVHVTAQLISAFVFATEIIQLCLIPKTVFFRNATHIQL